MSRCVRLNLLVFLGEIVLLEAYSKSIKNANQIKIASTASSAKLFGGDPLDLLKFSKYNLNNLLIKENMVIPINVLQKTYEFQVVSCEPSPCHISDYRVFQVSTKPINNQNLPNFSSISYADIGGLHEELKQIRRCIELPFLQPQIFDCIGEHPHRGILIQAPSGCGKTLLSRAICNETPLNFRYISGADLYPKSPENSLLILRRFADSALSNTPSIVFFDDIDIFICDKNIEKRLYYTILGIIDRILSNPETVFIATAKDSSQIPEQFLGVPRLSKVISISLPNKAQKADIFNVISRRILSGTNMVTDEFIDSLNVSTGSEIRLFIQRQIAMKALDLLENVVANNRPLQIGEILKMRVPFGGNSPPQTIEPTVNDDVFAITAPSSGSPFDLGQSSSQKRRRGKKH